MHELAITESVVSTVVDCVGGRKVTRVMLEIGKLSGVVPDALRFSFDVCTAGTQLESAELEIIEIEGRARCRACAGEVELPDFIAVCPCGGIDLEILSGDQLRIREVEVE
jgi:hydrogenase nickel incorporation protein HypA/HybF